jgi:hypothetical protein
MQAGASGRPILRKVNDEIRIVAVNSTEKFERQTDQGITNFATHTQQIVDRL